MRSFKKFSLLFLTFLFLTQSGVFAAQGDRIITVITELTKDIYADFVYLSLGFVITVCIYHLVMIILSAGDEQSRRNHIRAIITAVIAWILINVFAFIIYRIFSLTGSNTPSDIFDAGGYGG